MSISPKIERIAALAKQSPQMSFTTLAHHIDIDWLREAYRRTRKGGAAGVDAQTAAEYATNLEDNLRSLLDRAKSGTYRAPPVRRVHIPKGSGAETRPIGIPTFEDKVLQRAVAMVLEAVYEQDFLDCSYGFRPGRSAHDALNTLRNQMMSLHGGWVLEVDVEKFFDTIDHGQMRELLHRRVRDGVLLRLIGKWLNAGVLESGAISYPAAGTPQGGVISPLLANIYLHEVLDVWFERVVKPRLRGRAFLCRYADDFVMLFEHEEDAHRVLDVLPRRLGKHGLTIHPEKTRLVEFRRPLLHKQGNGGGADGPGAPRHVANPQIEEPDAVVPHVRIRGSPGRETARGHPSSPRCAVRLRSELRSVRPKLRSPEASTRPRRSRTASHAPGRTSARSRSASCPNYSFGDDVDAWHCICSSGKMGVLSGRQGCGSVSLRI